MIPGFARPAHRRLRKKLSEIAAWAETSALNRARVMFRFKALLEEHHDALARLITREHGKVLSDACIQVPYGGPALASGQRVYWQVRTWDAQDVPGRYSAPAHFEMGLLNPGDWKGKWITLPEEKHEIPGPAIGPLTAPPQEYVASASPFQPLDLTRNGSTPKSSRNRFLT